MIFSACGPKKQDISRDTNASLKYLLIKRRGTVDTVYRELVSLKLVDSVYELSYKTKWGYGDNDPYMEKIRLPIGTKTSPTTNGFIKMLDVKNIRYGNEEYKIYKFLLDDPNGADEETLYFFEPTFGLVIGKSAWWGNYDRLIETGNAQDNKTVFFLSEMIMYDSEFFKKY